MRPPHRNAVLAAAIAVPVVGMAAWAIGSSYRGTPERPPALLPTGATPVQRAAAACHDVERVQAFVAENADSATVFAYLDAATREIALAAEQQPMWLSLQSGIASLDRGLRRNDAGSSELGIAIARDECRNANVYLPGSVRPGSPPG